MNKQYFTTGAVKDKKDRRDYKVSGIISSVFDYPDKFELEDKFESKMQYSRGSCTSQAQAHHKQRQEDKKLSARFVMAVVKTFIEKNTGYGAYTRNSFKAVNKYGIPSEELYPEPEASMGWVEYVDANLISEDVFFDAIKNKSQSYWSVGKTVNDIKDVLLTGHSVVISMAWYSEFNKPNKDGSLKEGINYITGHAVEIIGWDDLKYSFVVKNSWGESWGNKGNFLLPYNWLDSVVWDCWTSLDIPVNMPVDDFYGLKRMPVDIAREIWIKVQSLVKEGRVPSRRELNAFLAYWSYDEVYRGTQGDLWLKMTKLEANKKGLIK